MASRDPNDLHPELRRSWEYMRDEWARRHPDAPKPFLTATYRAPVEQSELVRQGRSRALPGQSLHNFMPALAFDVAFLRDGAVTWEFHHYQAWGELAEEVGLEWGGRWKGLVDGPHVQLPVTWTDARAGRLPTLPPLPVPENPLLPVEVLHVKRADGTLERFELDPDRPARVVGSNLWANERPGEP